MIIDSIETLKKMSGPEIFEHIAVHLLTQGKRSLRADGRCSYRFEELACAVGCLIPDNIYEEGFEGRRIDSLLNIMDTTTTRQWAEAMRPHRDMLSELQNLHDQLIPSRWPEDLRRSAKRFDLLYPLEQQEYTKAYERAVAKAKSKEGTP